MTELLSPEATSRADEIFDRVDPLERDRPWKRPLLIPGPALAANPMVTNPSNRKPRTDGKLPYTRASSLGNYVADHTALEVWRRRTLTKGMGEREDLAALAASLPPIIGNRKNKEDMTKAEIEQDKITNAALDEIADKAHWYANGEWKADWGTAIHSFTDPGAHGTVPVRMVGDVASWEALTEPWKIVATEVFVANDDLQCAGTFDHIVTIPSKPELGALLLDKKTGLLHPDGMSIQLAAYARGEVYDPWTDRRAPLESLTDGVVVNRDWGLIAHIPVEAGRTHLYLVDLNAGWRGAKLAIGVREYRQEAKAFMRHVLTVDAPK